MRLAIACLLLAAAPALTACDHTAPFGAAQPQASDTTALLPGNPLRLTYNPLEDGTPSWLPDGSRFVYGAGRGDRGGDACLQLMRPSGGRSATLLCHTPVMVESLHLLSWAAITAAGRIAYHRTSERALATGRIKRIAWGDVAQDTREHQTRLAQLDVPLGPSLPAVSFVRWLDDRRLVWRQDYQFGPLISGRFIVIGDTEVPDLARVIMPGSDQASGVAVMGLDTLAWTRNGDSRVFRRLLATGTDSVLWDFGAAGIARDVHVAGRRLVAVVGGSVSYFLNVFITDSLQSDDGGDVWVVDLAAGTAAQLSGGPLLYRHPVLAPDGRSVIAVSSGDLYRFAVP